MKSSASLYQSGSKGEILGQVGRKERRSRSKLKQAFLKLIQTPNLIFMYYYLIQCVRFGS